MNAIALARPEIQALHPYDAAVQVIDTIRLNANESPWSSGADQFARPLNRYPEIRPTKLREALAKRFGCDVNRLLVTRGSSEAIDLLIRVFCRAGIDNILTTSPTFSMYRHYATIQGASVIEVKTSPDQDFQVDVDALLACRTENTKILFLCTPNNPTGTILPRSTLLELLQRIDGRSIVVVDEAYIEFACVESAGTLLGQFDNLVVLRTLSKALAYAGARCGAILASPGIVNMLDAVQAPYALATPVVECVLNALQTAWMHEAETQVQEIIKRRERMKTALLAIPVVRNVWPSSANFLLVQLNDVASTLEQCRKNRVLIRFFGEQLPDCVRITIGNAEECATLLESLNQVTVAPQ